VRSAVGVSVGSLEGITVVGFAVVGLAVSLVDGRTLGSLVGLLDGLLVGLLVGNRVGTFVGVSDDIFVGI